MMKLFRVFAVVIDQHGADNAVNGEQLLHKVAVRNLCIDLSNHLNAAL